MKEEEKNCDTPPLGSMYWIWHWKHLTIPLVHLHMQKMSDNITSGDRRLQSSGLKNMDSAVAVAPKGVANWELEKRTSRIPSRCFSPQCSCYEAYGKDYDSSVTGELPLFLCSETDIHGNCHHHPSKQQNHVLCILLTFNFLPQWRFTTVTIPTWQIHWGLVLWILEASTHSPHSRIIKCHD